MKPLTWFLPALLAVPAVAPLVSATADDHRESSSSDRLIGSEPLPEQDGASGPRLPFDYRQLSARIAVERARVARLQSGDPGGGSAIEAEPLVDPVRPSGDPSTVASLEASQLRRGPSGGQPSPSFNAVVRFGDTLFKIAERYGITLSELLRLNPGMETARLVVGTQIRVAQSSPGRTPLLLGLKPVGSGGLSWPDQPQFGGDSDRPFRGPVAGGDWVWPARGVFSSGYGWRWGRMHKGIDVANNVGTSIVAAREGLVTFAGWHDGGYGYLVEISHPDGSLTRYGHNSRLLVSEGQQVQQGQVIAQMGSTGRSTGPHLHFEIHPPGSGAVNPLQFLPPRA
jgi:murein DD-endopeptidase MepM/ murein hydrolase activator NlpD